MELLFNKIVDLKSEISSNKIYPRRQFSDTFLETSLMNHKKMMFSGL